MEEHEPTLLLVHRTVEMQKAPTLSHSALTHPELTHSKPSHLASTPSHTDSTMSLLYLNEPRAHVYLDSSTGDDKIDG
jgi:hypothetical protein